MKDRILKIINKEQLTSSKFADLIGVQRSSISHIISGRNNPSLDIVQKILLEFKTVNPEWLLFGTGDMYKKDSLPTLFDDAKRKIDKNIPQSEPVINLFNQVDDEDTIVPPPKIEDQPKEIVKEKVIPPIIEEKKVIVEKEIIQEPIVEKKVVQAEEKSEPKKVTKFPKAEKVLFFFSDNTFKEYSSSE